MDILNFLRDNGNNDVCEADCYYFVKFFDADEDGKLNYPEFLQIILPCLNHKLRASTTQRIVQRCEPTDFLAIDVEQDLSRLFKKEIEYHIETELLKQRLESMEDWSPEAVYSTVDTSNITYIDIKLIDSFFKRYSAKGIEIEDHAAIIRRLDLDNDSRLNKDEFLKGVSS